jgi:hypothetical protein
MIELILCMQLLATSKRAFSKSVDDLTSFAFSKSHTAKNPSVSSTSTNIFKARKSMEEGRRGDSNKEVLSLSSDESFESQIGHDKKVLRRFTQDFRAIPSGNAVASSASGTLAGLGIEQGSGASLAPPFQFPAGPGRAVDSTPSMPRITRSTTATTDKSDTSSSTLRASMAVPGKSSKQRESQIVLHEGILQRQSAPTNDIRRRKTVSRSFPFYASVASAVSSDNLSSSTSGGNREAGKVWTPYYAVVRGTKLWLYTLPSDLHVAAKSIFPNHATGAIASPKAVSQTLLEEARAAILASGADAIASCVLANNFTELCLMDQENPFAFKLTSEEGAVYRLQCPSAECRDAWLKVVSEASRFIANKRASYVETKLALPDLTGVVLARPLSVASTVEEQIASKACFGVELEALLARDKAQVPVIIEQLLGFVESKGLLEVYRSSCDGLTRR